MRNSFNSKDPRLDKSLFGNIRAQNRILIKEYLSYQDDVKIDRLLGCMAGLAIGDILGCPVEGMSPQKIRDKFGKIDRLVFPSISNYWRFPGLHSDDTQQALVILNAVSQCRMEGSFSSPFTMEQLYQISGHIARMYIKGIQGIRYDHSFGCWRGTGKGFRRVLKDLSNKNDNYLAWAFGKGVPSAGLGAVMRIPPFGLLPDITDDDLLNLVIAVTLITHTDIAALLCAYIVALACRILSNSSPDQFNPAIFFKELNNRIQVIKDNLTDNQLVRTYANKVDMKPDTWRLIKLFPAILDYECKKAMNLICSEVAQEGWHHFDLATAGYAPTGIAASLYFFGRNADDPEKALFEAINAGGDTDTIGAIVGALCGSLHGTQAYARFLQDLSALKCIEYVTISSIRPTKHSFDLVAYERSLTELESACRYHLFRSDPSL